MDQILKVVQKSAELRAGRKLKTRKITTSGEAELICEVMAHAPFYCGKPEGGPELPWCCSQHAMGLPKHRFSREPCPPTDFQMELVNAIIDNRNEASAGIGPAMRKYHVNKGRQMGFTEIILRVMAHLSFKQYAGRHIAIIAATNGDLAMANLQRFRELFDGPLKPVLNAAAKNAKVLELSNGTVIEALPASEEPITGRTNYAAIFMDESAKWKLIDDRPVFNSTVPVAFSSGGDYFVVSTPKGMRKTFYHIHLEPDDYVKFRFPITRAVKSGMYTQEEVDELIRKSKEQNPDIDVAQEYFCQFTSSSDSIFGMLQAEAVEEDWGGWAPQVEAQLAAGPW